MPSIGQPYRHSLLGPVIEKSSHRKAWRPWKPIWFEGNEGLFEGNEGLFEGDEGDEGHESEKGLESLDVSPGWWIVPFPHHPENIKKIRTWCKTLSYCAILWISFEHFELTNQSAMAMTAINSIDSHKGIHCWALCLNSLATGRLEGHESEKGLEGHEGLFEGNECLFEGNEGHESDEGLESLDVCPGWWIDKNVTTLWDIVPFCETNPQTTIVSTFDACVAWKKGRIGESIVNHVCEKLPASLWVSWSDMYFDMIWYRDFLKLPASRLELGIIFSKVRGVGRKCCSYDHFPIHHEMKSTHLRTCQFQAHLRKCSDLSSSEYHDVICSLIWYGMVWYIWCDMTLLYHILYITIFGSRIYH